MRSTPAVRPVAVVRREDPPGTLAIWGSPGLVVDPARPDLEAVASLTVVPATEDAPLAEGGLDLLVSALLVAGFDLVGCDDAGSLAALPVPQGWRATVDESGWVDLRDAGCPVFAGDLGNAAPPGWFAALRRRGLLVVLVTRAVDLARDERPDWRVTFRAEAPMAGAQVPVEGVVGASGDTA